LENYQLLQERDPEIGGTLSCQQMLAFLFKMAAGTPNTWFLEFTQLSIQNGISNGSAVLHTMHS